MYFDVNWTFWWAAGWFLSISFCSRRQPALGTLQTLNWTKMSVIFSIHSQKRLCCSGFSGLTGWKQVHPATAAGAEVSHETLMLCCCCCCCLIWDGEDRKRFEFVPRFNLNVRPRPYYSAGGVIHTLQPCLVWWVTARLREVVTKYSHNAFKHCAEHHDLLPFPPLNSDCTEITQHWFVVHSWEWILT